MATILSRAQCVQAGATPYCNTGSNSSVMKLSFQMIIIWKESFMTDELLPLENFKLFILLLQ